MKKEFWLGLCTLVIYSGVIFYISSTPGDSVPSLPVSDKILHFLVYLGLGSILTYVLMNLNTVPSKLWAGLTTFFCSTIYGLSDEVHQIFVPGRDFDLLDLTADSTGGIARFFLIYAFYQLLRKHSSFTK